MCLRLPANRAKFRTSLSRICPVDSTAIESRTVQTFNPDQIAVPTGRKAGTEVPLADYEAEMLIKASRAKKR